MNIRISIYDDNIELRSRNPTADWNGAARGVRHDAIWGRRRGIEAIGLTLMVQDGSWGLPRLHASRHGQLQHLPRVQGVEVVLVATHGQDVHDALDVLLRVTPVKESETLAEIWD